MCLGNGHSLAVGDDQCGARETRQHVAHAAVELGLSVAAGRLRVAYVGFDKRYTDHQVGSRHITHRGNVGINRDLVANHRRADEDLQRCVRQDLLLDRRLESGVVARGRLVQTVGDQIGNRIDPVVGTDGIVVGNVGQIEGVRGAGPTHVVLDVKHQGRTVVLDELVRDGIGRCARWATDIGERFQQNDPLAARGRLGKHQYHGTQE